MSEHRPGVFGHIPRDSGYSLTNGISTLILAGSTNHFLFLIGFDLNLPIDEYGAVDFDFVQNIAGKFLYFPCVYNY